MLILCVFRHPKTTKTKYFLHKIYCKKSLGTHNSPLFPAFSRFFVKKLGKKLHNG